MELNRPLIITDDTENLHLCFMLDTTTYALNAKYVLEVTTLPMINEPQRLPEYIAGILNYNDMFINVADIRKIFCLPPKKYELSNKVLIIKGEESLIAIIVDEVTDFFSASPASIQRVMGENSDNIIKTFYKLDDNVINIISIHQLEETIKKAHFEENKTNYAELFPQDEESVCILQKRRNEISRQPQLNLETDVYGKDQYILFKISNHTYCINTLFVRELVSPKNYPVTRMPYTPKYMEGLINHKGNFYTVLNLKKYIGFDDADENAGTEPDEKHENKIIIIESSELKIAFLVDDIVDIMNISSDHIEFKNDMQLDNMYIKAEAYFDNNVYNILNVDKLINEKRLYIGNN